MWQEWTPVPGTVPILIWNLVSSVYSLHFFGIPAFHIPPTPTQNLFAIFYVFWTPHPLENHLDNGLEHHIFTPCLWYQCSELVTANLWKITGQKNLEGERFSVLFHGNFSPLWAEEGRSEQLNLWQWNMKFYLITCWNRWSRPEQGVNMISNALL